MEEELFNHGRLVIRYSSPSQLPKSEKKSMEGNISGLQWLRKKACEILCMRWHRRNILHPQCKGKKSGFRFSFKYVFCSNTCSVQSTNTTSHFIWVISIIKKNLIWTTKETLYHKGVMFILLIRISN